MKSLEPLECFMAVLVQLMDGFVACTNQRMLTTQLTTSVVITRDAEQMCRPLLMQTFDSFTLVSSDQAGQMMQEHSIDALN